MAYLVEKYSQAERDAMAAAYEDRKIRPAQRVVELAAAGALEWEGRKLDPFQTTSNTVRSLARDLRRRRAGGKTSQLATLPPRDAVEALRRRLVNAADSTLADWERTKPKDRDLERGRQIARLITEAAKIPGPSDPRPSPGTPKDPETGKRQTETKGGLAGSILSAHRRSNGGAQEGDPSTTQHSTNPEDGEQEPAAHSAQGQQAPSTEHTDTESGPGAWARKQVEAAL